MPEVSDEELEQQVGEMVRYAIANDDKFALWLPEIAGKLNEFCWRCHMSLPILRYI